MKNCAHDQYCRECYNLLKSRFILTLTTVYIVPNKVMNVAEFLIGTKQSWTVSDCCPVIRVKMTR